MRRIWRAEPLPGLDDYPLDNVLIRTEHAPISDVVRRIRDKAIILDPEFQRDYVWPPMKQSRLIESVLMRIPLPVHYVAESFWRSMIRNARLFGRHAVRRQEYEGQRKRPFKIVLFEVFSVLLSTYGEGRVEPKEEALRENTTLS